MGVEVVVFVEEICVVQQFVVVVEVIDDVFGYVVDFVCVIRQLLLVEFGVSLCVLIGLFVVVKVWVWFNVFFVVMFDYVQIMLVLVWCYCLQL